MYKLCSKNPATNKTEAVQNMDTFAFIPFDPANVDFANFKKEVLAGAELQDADGNVMSQKDAEAFIKELP